MLRFAVILALMLTGCALGDTPAPARLEVKVSPDGSALLRITPNQGGDKSQRAVATVLKYDVTSGGYRKVVEFQLRNKLAPYMAIISDDARFIVAFDDWGEVGRTENAVVAYRGTGEFIRAWKLAEIFTDEEQKKFRQSTSSTWWHGEVRPGTNADGRQIVTIDPPLRLFELPADKAAGWQKTVIFDLATQSFEKR